MRMPQSSTRVLPSESPPGSDVAATLGLSGGANRGAKLRRRVLWWGIAALALVGGVLYVKTRHTQAPVHYQTVAARRGDLAATVTAVSYTHLRAHETVLDLVCRL